MVSDYSVIGPEQWRLQFGHHQLKPLSLMLKNGPLLKQRGTNDFRIINCFVYFCHLVKIINRFPSLFCISQNTLINNVLRHQFTHSKLEFWTIIAKICDVFTRVAWLYGFCFAIYLQKHLCGAVHESHTMAELYIKTFKDLQFQNV